MKKKAFWFRNVPAIKGMAGVGRGSPNTSIYLGKERVGWISYNDSALCLNRNKDIGIRLWFRFKNDETFKGSWRNAMLKYKAESKEDAIRFALEHQEVIEPKLYIESKTKVKT